MLKTLLALLMIFFTTPKVYDAVGTFPLDEELEDYDIKVSILHEFRMACVLYFHPLCNVSVDLQGFRKLR